MRSVPPVFALTLALVLVAAGCGGADPATLQATPLETEIEAGAQPETAADATETPTAGVLDLRTAEPAAPGDVAGATVGTNPKLTTSTLGTPAPPYTLTGAEPATPTVPTTRPPATAATSTTVQPIVTTTQTTQEVPADPAVDPAVDIVEFRIKAGTQAGPWNSFDNPVRVTVGQTLRVHNDDVVAHTLHSNGAPFEHGPTIQPGQFADHLIITTMTPDPAAPANYEHDAGVTAPLWVVATEAEQEVTSPTVPTPAGPPQLAAAEAESLRLLNELRAGLGLQTVTPSDQEMHAFARAWSLEMRNTGFRHSSPPRWFENIVWYSDETMTPAEAAAQFHDMWINSPGHYENMTNPDWSVVGVGMWHDETGWWGVHVFR